MQAYSKDLRLRVLDALDRGTPRPEVIALFGVSSPTITRWRRRRRETGSLAESPRRGPPSVKRAALRAGLLPQVTAHPDATLAQHCAWWEQAHGMRVSPATLSRVITRDLGGTRKKRP